MPFGRFRPDASRFNPQASTDILNCRPTADGWGPLRGLNVISDALPAAPRGAVAVKNDAGTPFIFVGTAANLYRINSNDYSFDEISRSTDDYSLGDSEYWSWSKFGNYLIATAVGSDYPQVVDLSSGSSTFDDLTNATFSAKYVRTVGDFLAFFGIDGNNRASRWSGINDMTWHTLGQRGADAQTLPDGGEIQGVIAQAANALIFQESAIKQMQFAPESGVVFRFVVVDPDRGVYAPRSIVNIGAGDFAYLAKNGFFRGPQAQPIGAERVDRWFFDQVSDAALVAGVADPYQKIVWWRYPARTGGNKLIGYNYQLDEWMQSDAQATQLLEAMTTGYTLEDLDDFGTLDTLPYSLDSRFWKGGLPGFAGFDADYKFGFFDGDNQEAVIETEDKALNYPRRAVSGRIQVLADTNAVNVALAAKETQGGSLMYDDWLAQEAGLSFINSRVSGKWHRVKARIAAGEVWSQATGIDMAFTDGGVR